MKHNIHSSIVPNTKEKICRKIKKFMLGFQENIEKVSCYFQYKKLEYIKVYCCHKKIIIAIRICYINVSTIITNK